MVSVAEHGCVRTIAHSPVYHCDDTLVSCAASSGLAELTA